MKHLLTVLLTLSFLLAFPASAEIIHSEEWNSGWYEFTGKYGMDGYMLCERLTVRESPSASAKAVATLEYPTPLIVQATEGNWASICASDGNISGFVRREYLLIHPSYLILEGETPVYAWGSTAANRVGLLDAGTRLAILHEEEEWLVVSLRGASAWVYKPDVGIAAGQMVTNLRDPFSPDQLTDIIRADLHICLPLQDAWTDYTLSDPSSLAQLSALLRDARYEGYQKYDCGDERALLTLTRQDGAQFTMNLATDDCRHFAVNNEDYTYACSVGGTNSVLYRLFGITLR